MLFKMNWMQSLFTRSAGQIKGSEIIHHVVIDSRIDCRNALFVPIVGERYDGHDFLKQAIEQGAIATLWNENKAIPDFVPDNFPVFFVSNTTDALQHLALHYRNKINPKVIGITGSNGKTTTKDIMTSILKTTYHTHATKGNLNNDIGLPLTILSMPQQTDMLIVEMGMNDFNEIDRLTRIAKPDFAIITNIGESHIEHLGSRDGIAKAKLEILNGLQNKGTLITDGDEPLLNSIHEQQNVIKCGFGFNNNYIISDVKLIETGTQFKINEQNTYRVPLYGKHHALNATFAIIMSQLLDITEDNIQDGLTSLKHTNMRFEFLKSVRGATLINDAYNASPTSMKGAIDVIKQFDQFPDKIVVLGDILELGSHAEEYHLAVAATIKKPITKLFTCGDDAAHISHYVSQHEQAIESKHFSTKEQLTAYLHDILHKNAIVLFKASRGMAFESIVKELI